MQIFFSARKRSCRKVMFLHLSVSHSVHRVGGVYLSMQWVRRCTPPGRHLPRQTPPRQTPLPPLGRHPPKRPLDGWYASYWNAFLSLKSFFKEFLKCIEIFLYLRYSQGQVFVHAVLTISTLKLNHHHE